MPIQPLPRDWEPTRATLQAYAHAVTAVPRAAAPADPRWGHVAMEVTPEGLTAGAVPLVDGAKLVSRIDLHGDEIVVTAGDDIVVIDMETRPTPTFVADAAIDLAARHGTLVEPDDTRYASTEPRAYDTGHAAAFHAAARSVVAALEEINDGVDGEITGPHLWPHGFDIATEWYGTRTVDHEGAPTSTQIAIGWYPAGDAYLYANPWPFDAALVDVPLPAGAVWNTHGWFGAKLAVADLDPASAHRDLVALGTAVHAAAGADLDRT